MLIPSLAAIGMAFPRGLKRYPTNSSTQKGNLAEALLAEYVKDCCSLELPVYRLRYNPNVDQSMKGDDVLAFDFTGDAPRLIVGEAKFRETPTPQVVRDIVAALLASHQAQVPSSLQFIADRLFEQDRLELGIRVYGCAQLIAEGRLKPEYVGLLMSDSRAHEKMHEHTASCGIPLAVVSLAVSDPVGLVSSCYGGLT